MFADAMEHSLEEGDVSRRSIRIALKHWLYNSMRKSDTGNKTRGSSSTVEEEEEDEDDDRASSSGRSLVISTLTLSNSNSNSNSTSRSNPDSNSVTQPFAVTLDTPGKNTKGTRFRGSLRGKLDRIKLSYMDFTQRSTAGFPVQFLNSCGSEMDDSETTKGISTCDTPLALSIGLRDSTAERSNASSGSDEDKLSCYKSFRTGLEDLNVLFEYTMRNGLSSRDSSAMFMDSVGSESFNFYRRGRRSRSQSTPFKALVYEDLQRDDSELLNIISRCSEVVEEEQGELPSSIENTKPTENELNSQTGPVSPGITSETKFKNSDFLAELPPPSRQYDENIVLYVDTSMNFSTGSKRMFPGLKGTLQQSQENCQNEFPEGGSDCDYSQISESQTSAYSITSESSCSTMSSGDLTSSAQSSREPSSEVYSIPTFREGNNRRLSVSGIISTLRSPGVTEGDLEKLVGSRGKLEYQGSAFYDELPENYFESVSHNNNSNEGTMENSLSSPDLGDSNDLIIGFPKSKNCSVRFYDKSQLLVYGPQGGGGSGGGKLKETIKDKEPLSVRSILKRKENIRSDIELKVAQSCDAVDVKSFLKSFKYYEKIKSNEHERYSRIRESQMERYYSWERSGSWMGKNRR